MTSNVGRIIQWKGDEPLPRVPNANYASLMLKVFTGYKDNVALVDGLTDKFYTYKDLLEIIPRMRNGLAKAGVRPGDRVLLITPNHIDMPLSVISVILVGAACVPVNPGSTEDELKHVIGLSEAKWAIVHGSVAKRTETAFGNMRTNSLREMWIIGDGSKATRPSLNALMSSTAPDPQKQGNFDSSTSVALMPLSSGTTGLPKGVMLSHRNLIATQTQRQILASQSPLGKINLYESVVIIIPVYHMMGFNLTMNTLFSGGKAIVFPKFSSHIFFQAIEKHKATFAMTVPYVLRFLENSGIMKQYDLSSLLMFATGSEPVSSKTLQNITEKSGRLALQGYGMSESSGIGTGAGPDVASLEHCIGKLQPLFQAKIIDTKTGELLGEGKDGELCMRGPSIMLGYANNPKATAETIDSDGWLHTGDIAHFDEDDNFYITGRIKDLIKVKGYQVAPVELENIIKEMEGVKEVAVAGVPHERLGEAPRAWVIPKEGVTLYIHDIIKHVADCVMPYKQLAGGVELVTVIPKNHIGKVLRRQLRNSYESKRSSKL